MKRVLAIILGGGAGRRLQPLTRAKPAVPLGGKYRLIDIPISNCIHSGINKIYALTQFNSQSLNRHLSLTSSFSGRRTARPTPLAVLSAPTCWHLADPHDGTPAPSLTTAAGSRGVAPCNC